MKVELAASALLLYAFTMATALSSSPREAASAAQLAAAAQRLCDDAAVGAALQSVGLTVDNTPAGDRAASADGVGVGDAKMPATRSAASVLVALGFRTVRDLRLLAGGPEAAELMDGLKADGGLSIADRAKIRLLIGDRLHLERFLVLSSPSTAAAAAPDVSASTREDRSNAAQHMPRSLQSDQTNHNNLSMETIAILCSVCIGVGGYLIQAWTSNKHNRHEQELQREHTQQAQESQREERRTLAQMRRTERWVDDCCVPIARALAEYNRSRFNFVGSLAIRLEAAEPEAFASLYAAEYSMSGVEVQMDGTTYALGQQALATTYYKGVRRAQNYFMLGCSGGSQATVDILYDDVLAYYSRAPYVEELPRAFFELLAGDLDGLLAEDYRSYIRHEVKPVLERVTGIVHAHYAAIEVPPLEWLLETFPGQSTTTSPNIFMDGTIAYGRAWDRIFVQWDAGKFDNLFPPNHMIPWCGLFKFITWSKERGTSKQNDLIGMSSGRKDATSKMLDVLSREDNGNVV